MIESKQTCKHYDIVIVGAGPAGANFARLIDSKRYRTLLIDGSADRDKVCGGLLSPDAQDILARYDISLPRDLLASPQLFSVRTVDLATGMTRYYRRSYLNVDRRRFDDFLRTLIPPQVAQLAGRCEEIRPIPEGYSLSVGGQEITCTYLIGADGASSIVRRSLFADRPIRKYIAIQQWFPAEGDAPYYSCLFDYATSTGCSWIFFKDGMLIFGGAFDNPGGRTAFEAQKQKLIAHGLVRPETVAAPAKTEACTVLRPTWRRGIWRGEGKAFLLGEAAGLISPSSFEGISYALASAEALADAFGVCGEASHICRMYRRRSQKLVRKIRLRCLKRPFMYHRILRTWVLKSGFTAIHIRKEDNS